MTLDSLHLKLADQYRANAKNDKRIKQLWALIDLELSDDEQATVDRFGIFDDEQGK